MCQVHTATFIVLLAPENTDYTACHPEKRLPRIHYTWYLSLRMLTSDASQLQKRKEKNRQGRKKRGITFRFNITLCQAETGAHCSYLLWAIYMAVSMPGHCDLTAIFMSRMALSWRSGYQLYRFIPRSSVSYELRSHGNFLPYASSMQENPRKY